MLSRVRELNLLKMQRKVAVMGLREILYLLIIAGLIIKDFNHEEHIVFYDPVSQARMSFKGDAVSKEYLEDMTIMASHLLLDKNKSNIQYNHNKLLKYIHPDNHTKVKRKLLVDAKKYKKENLSTSFYPNLARIDMNNNTVTLPGELLTRVGDREVLREKKIFKLSFKNVHVTWYMTAFEIGEEKKDV
ncbi:MAG: hypothetical protein HRT87_06540 [Legionellales bacterium]|nr:hypothetical protein [Legionellales bacterium]